MIPKGKGFPKFADDSTLNQIRGKAMVGRQSIEDVWTLLDHLQLLEHMLDEDVDANDALGTEGWRHHAEAVSASFASPRPQEPKKSELLCGTSERICSTCGHAEKWHNVDTGLGECYKDISSEQPDKWICRCHKFISRGETPPAALSKLVPLAVLPVGEVIHVVTRSDSVSPSQTYMYVHPPAATPEPKLVRLEVGRLPGEFGPASAFDGKKLDATSTTTGCRTDLTPSVGSDVPDVVATRLVPNGGVSGLPTALASTPHEQHVAGLRYEAGLLARNMELKADLTALRVSLAALEQAWKSEYAAGRTRDSRTCANDLGELLAAQTEGTK